MQTIKLIITIIMTGIFFSLFGQTAPFKFIQQNTCDQSILFVADTVGYSAPFRWDFGDGSTAKKGSRVNHKYVAYGIGSRDFKVTLKAKDQNGNDTTFFKNITIKEVPDPVFHDANIFTPFASCDGVAVSPVKLVAPSKHTPNAKYKLSFEKGRTYEGNQFPDGVEQWYKEEGRYAIMLSVEGPNGCSSSHTQEYFYGRNPGIISLGMAQLPHTVCAPFKVAFYVHGTENNSPGTRYRLEISDGTSMLLEHPLPDSIEHVFTKTSCGFNTPNGFKDAFYARITAFNNCGEASGTVEPIRISSPPSASIGVGKPKNGECVGEVYRICDQSNSNIYFNSLGTCSRNVRRKWSITPSTGFTVVEGGLEEECFSVVFHEANNYEFSLEVESACGKSKANTTVTPLDLPKASFDWEVDSSNLCERVIVLDAKTKNTSSVGWDINAESSWKFADSEQTNSKRAQVVVSEGGTFEVNFNYSNQCKNEKVTEMVQVPILAIANLPADTTVCIETAPYMLKPGLDCNFKGPGTDACGTFDARSAGIGHHEICYTEKLGKNCEKTRCMDIEVVGPPSVQLPDTISVCSGNEVVDLALQLRKLPHLQTSWYGEGVSADGKYKLPSTSGHFPLTLNLVSDKGCSSMKSIVVAVSEPEAVRAMENPRACLAHSVFQLWATPQGGTWEKLSEDAPPVNSITGEVYAIIAGVYTYRYTCFRGSTCEVYDEVTVEFVDIISRVPAAMEACTSEREFELPDWSPLIVEWSSPDFKMKEGKMLTWKNRSSGDYIIHYTATDTVLGCTVEESMVFRLVAPPNADFAIDDNLCVNSPLKITNHAPAHTRSVWQFDNHKIPESQEREPSLTFDKVGTYGINHEVYYQTGRRIDETCFNKVSKNFNVEAPPSLDQLIISITPNRKGGEIKLNYVPGINWKNKPDIVPVNGGAHLIKIDEENGCGALKTNFELGVENCPKCKNGTVKKSSGFFERLIRKIKSFFNRKTGCEGQNFQN